MYESLCGFFYVNHMQGASIGGSKLFSTLIHHMKVSAYTSRIVDIKCMHDQCFYIYLVLHTLRII